MHPRNPILLCTHVADPLPSSIPSANGAGIKSGRPLGNLRQPAPSSNPLKRKLSMETVPENSIPWLSDSIAKIREDGKSGVENLTEECVSTMADVTRLLMKIGGTEFRMRLKS
ncbi:kinesin-like protein KIN12B [Cucumis melo var. makuwa]|uniref:Kinesin-like protein KIN12B n=1 Tax=Cucumis melo var. makuwa TaxID=1194695 RepID=A0A5A7UMK9_CUCMM|nr:kinesin-like protein KIN12B [Cucumis melo var. makuwa]KAA0054855.1 kinesin-like protein KIN12B [Cucumis melo var. makuwa]